MYVNLLLVLYLGLLSLLVKRAYCLVCKQCEGDTPTCSVVKNLKCETMGGDYDTCITFTGNFVGQDGTKHDGSIVRSCGQSAKLKLMSISKDGCTKVNQAKDAAGSTFSGQFCLCSSDNCNAAKSTSTTFTYSVLALFAGLSFFGFVAL